MLLSAGLAGAAELVAAAEAAFAGRTAAGSGVGPRRGRGLCPFAGLRRSGRDDFAVSEPFHRLRHGIELGDSLAGELNAQRTLNLADFVALLASAEGVGHPAGTGATGAANSVDEVFGNHRQVEVDDVRDAVDVDAAGGDVGGDQDAVFALLETGERAVALALRAVTVNAGCLHTDPGETLGELLDPVTGAGKHEERSGLAAEHMVEEIHFPVMLDFVEMEVDVFGGLGGRSEGDANRIREVLRDELGGAGLDGGREEQRLALFRNLPEDLVQCGQEAHVEHPVAFVKNDVGDLAQIGETAVEEVTETSWGGDDNLHAAAERVELGTFGHAANNGGGAEAGALRDFIELLGDLDGQFAGGAQYESAWADGLTGGGGLLQHRFDERQAKGKSLAGSGLRRGNEIVAGESGGDGFRLDGRRYRVALLIQVAQEYRGQRQVSEEIHLVFERRSQINDPTVVLAKYEQGK